MPQKQKVSNITINSSLKLTSRSLRKYKPNQSPRDWLIAAIKDIGNYCVEVPLSIRDWKTITEAQALLRELEIQEEVLDAQFTGLGRTMITRELEKTRLIRSQGSFVALLSPVRG